MKPPSPLYPCSACPKYHPPIPGDGPVPCSIMVIGEAPARRELEGQARDRVGWGKVLVGDSGAEYAGQYLKLAGLDRDSVYTTGITKCAGKSLDSPTPERASTCAEFHLHSELRTVQPQVIITLGAVALHTLFPGHSMDMEHGIPFYGSWGGWSGVVVPMYHPAAGLHQAGRFMTLMREDWAHLGELLRSRVYISDRDPWMGREDYQECVTPDHVIAYMGGRDIQHLAIDTEVENMTTLKPFCLSFSHSPGTSRVIRASSTDALQVLSYYCQDRQTITVFHNAGFDPPVLDAMGVKVHGDRFLDTMMMAYHLGRYQQSLKVLAYRLCGMRMKEFADVAGPHSKQQVMDWLVTAHLGLNRLPCWVGTSSQERRIGWVCALHTAGLKKTEARKYLKELIAHEGDNLLQVRGKPVFMEEPHDDHLTKTLVTAVNRLKTGHEKTVQRINSLLTALTDNQEDTDPWERFADWSPEVQADLLTTAGPMPELSITHVPWPEALHYSARDADATIRILPILQRHLRGVGRETL